jgi:predicted metalloprotease
MHYSKKYLDDGDIEETLRDAHAEGNDAIESKKKGHVMPQFIYTRNF